MGCDYPMSIPMDGAGFTGGFLSAYDVLPEFYQVDGKVKFGLYCSTISVISKNTPSSTAAAKPPV